MADTKTRLQALVSSTPQARDKSLLLQTVALFETLLNKIHSLQDDNTDLKSKLKRESEASYDQVVLDLESTRLELTKAQDVSL